MSPRLRLLWLYRMASRPCGVAPGYACAQLEVTPRALRRMLADLRRFPGLVVSVVDGPFAHIKVTEEKRP